MIIMASGIARARVCTTTTAAAVAATHSGAEDGGGTPANTEVDRGMI